MLDLHSPQRTAVEGLQDILKILSGGDSRETIENNWTLIDWLGQPEQIVPIIRQILRHESVLAEVASRSYRHVNHFDKIVLVGSDDPRGYRLTLHLWDPPYSEQERDDELIHEHRFNFWSVILTGTLRSENFARTRDPGDGVLYRNYRYIPTLGRTKSFCDFYEFRGEVRLRKIEPHVWQAGDSYYLSAPQIHRVALPRESMTCSLVLRGERLREYSEVYNSTYPSADTRLAHAMFSPAQLADKLVRLLGVLAKENAR
jgi:hypothetical protein